MDWNLLSPEADRRAEVLLPVLQRGGSELDFLSPVHPEDGRELGRAVAGRL